MTGPYLKYNRAPCMMSRSGLAIAVVLVASMFAAKPIARAVESQEWLDALNLGAVEVVAGSNAPLENNLAHVPASEQLALTAIPVFVGRTELDVATMRIVYRAFGSLPRSAPMLESTDGFSFLIPCGEVFEPFVDYVIFAQDRAGQTVGSFGSIARPVRVAVVTQRTTVAPALPGAAPPTQCRPATECPDGALECQPSAPERLLGEACDAEHACAEGLSCQSNICSVQLSRPDAPRQRKRGRVVSEVTLGVSLVHVGRGKSPDRLPSETRVEALRSQGLDDEAIEGALFQSGWDCDATTTPGAVLVEACAVAVNQPGFVAVPVLNATVGYEATPRLVVSVTARAQLRRGQGPLAGTVLGARIEYLVTRVRPRGFRLGLLAGIGVGSVQALPRANDSVRGAPYASSSNIGKVGVVVQLGPRMVYLLTPEFGVSASVTTHLGVPHLLTTLDVAAGGEVRF